jgi:hypothetical protein
MLPNEYGRADSLHSTCGKYVVAIAGPDAARCGKLVVTRPPPRVAGSIGSVRCEGASIFWTQGAGAGIIDAKSALRPARRISHDHHLPVDELSGWSRRRRVVWVGCIL